MDLIFSRVTTKWRITVSQWPTSGISNLTALPSATKGSVEKRSKRGKILVSKARICKFQMETFCSVPVTIGVLTRAWFHESKWRRLFSLHKRIFAWSGLHLGFCREGEIQTCQTFWLFLSQWSPPIHIVSQSFLGHFSVIFFFFFTVPSRHRLLITSRFWLLERTETVGR